MTATTTIVTCPACGTRNRVDLTRTAQAKPICGNCGAVLENAAPANHPAIVTDATFATQVLGAGETPVLLDCWAPWCGPCRMLAPTLDQLAAEANGRYLVAKLNTDENPRVAGQFRIEAIPTMLIFKNGQLVDRIVGLATKPQIAKTLAQHL